jgi:hypothetical protein
MIRRLIVPLTAAVVSLHAGHVFAQGAFPAPLPNQSAAPANASPFPPVNGVTAAPVQSAAPAGSSVFDRGAAPTGGMAPASPPQASGGADACMKGFVPLREEAEKRGKLIGHFGQAELKMIKYVETNSAKCGIPPQIAEQLKNGHKNTEKMQKQVCAVAQQAATRGPAGPSLSEVLGSSAAMPEAQTVKKGGSTFDTLNGNVLSR